MKLLRRPGLLICSGLLIAATLLAAPFASVPIGTHPTYVLALGIAFATTEALTAILLLWRAADTNDVPSGYLAGAYTVSTPIFVANLVLLVGGPAYAKYATAAPWLSLGWHVGWCAFASAFAFSSPRWARFVFGPAAAGFAAAIAYCAIVITTPLPLLIDHNVTTPIGYGALTLMLVCCLGTTIALFFRTDRALASWVAVAALALALHAALNIFAETRYSVGYYFARVLISINGMVVLVALVTALGGAVRRATVLADTERRLRMLLEGLPQLVWTARPDGSIDWCNSRWTEYTGRSAEALAADGGLAFYHPDDVAIVMQRLRRSLATGDPFEAEHRVRRADGMFEWFLARMTPERSDDGAIARWLGSLTNIDAQKREQHRSLRIARVMQQAFLPDVLPQVPGAILDALYEPAESEALIGGDWYDVVRLADDRLLITCGDVTGHGLEAAILAGRFRHTIAFVAIEDPDPARVLERVNRAAVTQWDAIATAVVAIVDLPAHTMRYAIAGHPPPLIVSRYADAFLPPGGLPLGTQPDGAYQTQSIALSDEALVVFYTDGLLEFDRDPLGALDSLRAASRESLEDSYRSSALAIKQHVLGDARPRDDIAILVLQTTAGEHRPPRSMQPLSKTWRFHSHDAASARDARRSVARFLEDHAGASESLSEAELIVGESLANTVQHAPGLVEVTVEWSGEHAKLIVCDSGPGLGHPIGNTLPDIMDENGRGLFIIAALAPDLHIRDIPGGGLELRCTLPVRRSELSAT